MGKLKWHILLVIALWLVFCGMASATQFYVNEGGWWCDGGADFTRIPRRWQHNR